jgi:hypothetical protein
VGLGGEVIALDSAGFGSSLTIDKAVTITAAPGVHAGIMVFSGDGITVNAGGNDVVTLRGLTVRWFQASGFNNGIVYNSGSVLHIENCVVSGFSTRGIWQTGSGPSNRPVGTVELNLMGSCRTAKAG